MSERTVSASVFKERCLALLDQVQMTGVPLVVTKRGRPVAKVVPLEERVHRSTMGSVTILTDNPEDLYSTGVEWPEPEPPH